MISYRVRPCGFRHGLRTASIPLLACFLACQQPTWEQYMDAAVFAYQDERFDEAEAAFTAAERIARDFDDSDARLAITLGNLATGGVAWYWFRSSILPSALIE